MKLLKDVPKKRFEDIEDTRRSCVEWSSGFFAFQSAICRHHRQPVGPSSPRGEDIVSTSPTGEGGGWGEREDISSAISTLGGQPSPPEMIDKLDQRKPEEKRDQDVFQDQDSAVRDLGHVAVLRWHITLNSRRQSLFGRGSEGRGLSASLFFLFFFCFVFFF